MNMTYTGTINKQKFADAVMPAFIKLNFNLDLKI